MMTVLVLVLAVCLKICAMYLFHLAAEDEGVIRDKVVVPGVVLEVLAQVPVLLVSDPLVTGVVIVFYSLEMMFLFNFPAKDRVHKLHNKAYKNAGRVIVSWITE